MKRLTVTDNLAKRKRCNNLIAAIVSFRRSKEFNGLNLLRVRQSLINWVLVSDHSSFFPDTRKRHMRPKWFFVCLIEGSEKVFLQSTKLICSGALRP